MGSIPNRRTSRVKADGQLEPKHGRDLRCQSDRERPCVTALDPADHRVRDPDHTTELTLAQTGRHAADEELGADPIHEQATAPLTAMDGTIMRWHPWMVSLCAYLARTGPA
jgi:hypothetical protein